MNNIEIGDLILLCMNFVILIINIDSYCSLKNHYRDLIHSFNEKLVTALLEKYKN